MTLKQWTAYVTDEANWEKVDFWRYMGWELHRLVLPEHMATEPDWYGIRYHDSLLEDWRWLRIGCHEYWRKDRPIATGMCASGLAKHLWNVERGKSE